MKLANPIVVGTLAVWVALELGVRIREQVRRKGGTATDRGTRILIVLTLGPTFWLVVLVARAARHDHALWLPGKGSGELLALGLVVMWAGLGLRAWSIASLGESFRTTVEIDEHQRLVDRGPYRWLRHPSYTGLLLITTGYGLESGTWPALLLSIALPLVGLARRIQVEERALTEAMGAGYRDYMRRTKRIFPGVW